MVTHYLRLQEDAHIDVCGHRMKGSETAGLENVHNGLTSENNVFLFKKAYSDVVEREEGELARGPVHWA